MKIDEARAAFAEELRFVAHVRSERLVTAFAKVPRERFLGERPWQVADLTGGNWELTGGYWEVPGDDPADAYHNVLFAIDSARQLNNGHPEFWAKLLDSIAIKPGERVFHVGAGTGYYTAILAELVGSTGRVVAAEIDPPLAARAGCNLQGWPQVELVTADGADFDPGAVDVIVVNAGATHPLKRWIDALQPGGRLLLPLTIEGWRGTVFRIERQPGGYAAETISDVASYPCAGARNEAAGAKLSRALAQGGQRFVRSLRCDAHPQEQSCWLHGDGFCLSIRPPAGHAR